MKKKISIYLLAVLSVFVQYSCSNFLEEEIKSEVTSEYYKTKKGMESLVTASYSFLRFGVTGEDGYIIRELGTDCFTEGGDGGYRKSYNRYEASLDPQNGAVYSIWDNHYRAINTVNMGLELMPQLAADDAFKKKKTAELRFLRANFYFDLVQQYGAIPVNTEAFWTVKTDFKRSPVTDVYKLIIDDLRYAVDNLPETGTESGYATTYAASHLLSKVYLTRGSAVTEQRGQKPSDMDSVIYYGNKVVESGIFSLEKNFSDVFDINNRNSSEFIFSVQFTADEIFNEGGNKMHLYYVSVYENFPGMLRDVENGRAWKRARPTDFSLYELFDSKNDARLYKSFQWVYKANNPSTIPVWKTITDTNGNVIFTPDPELEGKPKFQLGDTAVCFVPYPMELSESEMEKYRASKPYEFFPLNMQTELYYPTLSKWLDPNRPSPNEAAGTRNWVKMRLSETYLMLAEAYGRKNDFDKAAEYINIIRSRAAYKENEYRPDWAGENGTLASTETGMKVTPSEISKNFVDFMLDESGREFLGEIRRWEDLVRCEKLVERVKAHNKEAAPNIKEYHKLRPIPQNHIDRLDPVGPMSEEQNEGYY